MKKQIKKVVKPFLKPLLNRLSQLDERIKILEQNNYITEINSICTQQTLQFAPLEYELKKVSDEFQLYSQKSDVLFQELKQNSFNKVENIFYYHGGSGNHGCEALLRTICDINGFDASKNLLFSYQPQEDYKFSIPNIIEQIYLSKLDSSELGDYTYKNGTIAFSIGGDNYCGYDYCTKNLACYNRKFNEKGAVTALIGCSIEPDVLDHHEVLDDLEQFSLITARESITYEALLEHGISRNVHLVPDSAFTLKVIEKPLPIGFKKGRTIGINVSDLVQSYDSITYDNYKNLISYILDNTDYHIAFIPHVVQSFNDDLKILKRLHREFSQSDRVCFIPECNCMELKGYISRCNMFIGARTHASIAAYSTCVPTLVLGYSVKSKGIAKDLFGTYDNYVLSVHDLEHDDDLVKSFQWLDQNQHNIKEHLEQIMPEYIKRCYELKPLIDKIRYREPQLLLAPSSKCSGCGLCVNVCPKKCISMEYNDKGFLEPVIDYTKCIHCNLCKQKCNSLKDGPSIQPIYSYAAQAKDDNIRKNSSSGGIFSLLAGYIIKNNGVVFGASSTAEGKVKHISISKLKDISKLRGSKYVQSDVRTSYQEVKKYLKDGKKVLFTGTPCQIKALKTYLGYDDVNLFCVDVICHGVSSPVLYEKYLSELEEKHQSKIKSFDFRNKSQGWVNFSVKICFENGEVIEESLRDNIYMKAFLKNLNLRESCFQCNSNNFRSNSDMTIGDYWGVDILYPNHEHFSDDLGTSLIMVHSQKGSLLFEKIKTEMYYMNADIEKTIPYNSCIVSSVMKNERYEEFWNSFMSSDVLTLLQDYRDEVQ